MRIELRATPRAVALAWLAVMLCIAAIWTFSSDSFSARGTSRFLRPLLLWLFPELHWRTLNAIQWWIRKAAHVTEYGLLALLAFRALWLTLHSTWARIAALSLLLVLAVAGADETRQHFVPARTGSARDVALDLSGGALALLGLLAVHRVWRHGAARRRASPAG